MFQKLKTGFKALSSKIVAEYFQAKRLKKDYIGSKDIIRHVDETLKMLSVLTGDNTFEKVYNEINFETQGGVAMCDVVERIMNKGILQGMSQGISQGFSQGISQGKKEIIQNLIASKAGSIEQIASWVKLPASEIRKIAENVERQ